jgi:hypothetical protein
MSANDPKRTFAAKTSSAPIVFKAKRGNWSRKGKTLYTHNVGGQPIAGGVMTYEAAGHQYVAIVSLLHPKSAARTRP